MTILEVIREIVLALYTSPQISTSLYLKGGTALHLSEKLDSRLSTDIDLSTPDSVESEKELFREFTEVLSARFAKMGYDVIDAKHGKRPKRNTARTPKGWGGWQYLFKLSDIRHRRITDQQRSKSAFVPEGASSSKIEIQVSENEYCGSVRTIIIAGTRVAVYSGVLLILEKMRAICQQHSSYKYSQGKNRARDYYDIFNLVQRHRKDSNFLKQLGLHLNPVFEAKEVSLGLLDSIFQLDFLEKQAAGFPAVQDTVRGQLEPFSFYSEHLKFLIQDIRET